MTRTALLPESALSDRRRRRRLRDRVQPRVDLIPERLVDDPKFGNLLQNPFGAGIAPRLTFAGRRILHEALPVPDESSGVQLVAQNARSALGVAADGRI